MEKTRKRKTATAAAAVYSPPFRQLDVVPPPKVTRITTDIQLGNYTVSLIGFDSPNIISKEPYMPNLNKFKKIGNWTYDSGVVVAVVKEVSNKSLPKDPKVFACDTHAWLHAFPPAAREWLVTSMRKSAAELSRSWNTVNGSAANAKQRQSVENEILIDARTVNSSRLTGKMYMALVGTTYNFTSAMQDQKRDLECPPESVFFQLMFKSTPKEFRKGVLALPMELWVDMLRCDKFDTFYRKLNRCCKLPENYTDGLEEAFERYEHKRDRPNSNKRSASSTGGGSSEKKRRRDDGEDADDESEVAKKEPEEQQPVYETDEDEFGGGGE